MMNRQHVSYWVMVGLTALAVVGFVLAVTTFAHSATTSNRHNNSLGVIMQSSNPNSYVEGAVTNVALIESGVNLRIQPRGMYSLYTEELLLCDYENVADKFRGKGGLMVLTYETVAHRTIGGIGCHELRSVDEIKPTGGLQ